MNVDPCPIPSLSTVTLPPICSMRCLHMLNPKPVPCLFKLLWSANRLKLMNSLPISAELRPGPESVIRISNEIKLTFSQCDGFISFIKDEKFLFDSKIFESDEFCL